MRVAVSQLGVGKSTTAFATGGHILAENPAKTNFHDFQVVLNGRFKENLVVIDYVDTSRQSGVDLSVTVPKTVIERPATLSL